MYLSFLNIRLQRLTVLSDHCIEQPGLCLFPETCPRQYRSNDPNHNFASHADSQTAFGNYNGLSEGVFSGQTECPVNDIRSVADTALPPSYPRHTNVSNDLSSQGDDTFDNFDWTASAGPTAESQRSFSSAIRQSADEALAYNPQLPTYLFSKDCNIQTSPSTPTWSASPSVNENELQQLDFLSNESSPSSLQQWPTPSSSTRESSRIPEDGPIGKIRIEKPIFRPPRRTALSPHYTCNACSQSFKYEKDLTRHRAQSCSALRDKGSTSGMIRMRV